MPFITHLSNFISISKPLEAEINSITKGLFFSKGQTLININERCDSMFFIVKGLVRGYYLDDGKEVTNWFRKSRNLQYAFIHLLQRRLLTKLLKH